MKERKDDINLTEKLRTDILPSSTAFLQVNSSGELNLKAICLFAATGFFLEKDSYYKNQVALQPATDYEWNEQRAIIKEDSYWNWHYSPREINLKEAAEEFGELFEQIVKEQVGSQHVILPLSGGLDSRTQAAALRNNKNVFAYSYEFLDGISETQFSASIAKAMNFTFKPFIIQNGYLWDKIESLAEINGCYSEFTHPRQMAFEDEYVGMGDLFCLGHWGDVLFDDMGVPDDLPLDQQVMVVLKKIIKKGGMELGNALWQAWGLEGDFRDYLWGRVDSLLRAIHIDNANTRIRAFKSLYWAPRWTTTNLQVFAAVRPVVLPYYHDDMCKFICTVPEKHLAGRQIQIEYLKMKTPALARIPWQAHRPFNLYHYRWDQAPWNLPYRIWNKAKRGLNQAFGKELVQRNWELQFLGAANEACLETWLLEHKAFEAFVPKELVQNFYAGFKSKNPVDSAHAVSMLLTLSLFAKKHLS